MRRLPLFMIFLLITRMLALQPILPRRCAPGLFEQGVEIVFVVVSDLLCDFGNFHLGISQQHTCRCQSVAVDQLGK